MNNFLFFSRIFFEITAPFRFLVPTNYLKQTVIQGNNSQITNSIEVFVVFFWNITPRIIEMETKPIEEIEEESDFENENPTQNEPEVGSDYSSGSDSSDNEVLLDKLGLKRYRSTF